MNPFRRRIINHCGSADGFKLTSSSNLLGRVVLPVASAPIEIDGERLTHEKSIRNIFFLFLLELIFIGFWGFQDVLLRWANDSRRFVASSPSPRLFHRFKKGQEMLVEGHCARLPTEVGFWCVVTVNEAGNDPGEASRGEFKNEIWRGSQISSSFGIFHYFYKKFTSTCCRNFSLKVDTSSPWSKQNSACNSDTWQSRSIKT